MRFRLDRRVHLSVLSAVLLGVAVGSLAWPQGRATADPRKAMSFATTLPPNTPETPLVTLDNGLILSGGCFTNSGVVSVSLKENIAGGGLEAVGFLIDGAVSPAVSAPVAIGSRNAIHELFFESFSPSQVAPVAVAAIGVTAAPVQGPTSGIFERIDVIGELAGTAGCVFRGMVIPSES